MNKKALFLTDKAHAMEQLGLAEELEEQGYDLYATGETVLLFNMNMIAASVFLGDQTSQFDCIIH